MRNPFEYITKKVGFGTARQNFNFYAGLILGAFVTVFIARIFICPWFGIPWYVEIIAWISALMICIIPLPIPIIVYGIVFGALLGIFSAKKLRQ